MIGQPVVPVIALATAVAAIVAWSWVLVRSLRAMQIHHERRPMWVVMPISALVVSIGTLASAIGLAQFAGTIDLAIDADTLGIISSMGRGALLMAGVIAAATYRPEL